jgi:hypothetical protein
MATGSNGATSDRTLPDLQRRLSEDQVDTLCCYGNRIMHFLMGGVSWSKRILSEF